METPITKTSEEKSIARWETRGKDFLELFQSGYEKDGKLDFSYRGNGCCGGFWADSAEQAIEMMEAPRNNGKYPWGQVDVLKCDRPSVRRVR